MHYHIDHCTECGHRISRSNADGLCRRCLLEVMTWEAGR